MGLAMISYSAPGSLMIMGEHAVLRGHHAIVSSIQDRLTIHLTPRSSKHLSIHSSLGEYHATLGALDDSPTFDYLLHIIRSYEAQLPSGFTLNIESNIHHEYGLGSSAAICIALHACLHHWTHQAPAKPENVLKAAKASVLSLKKTGSGSDLAASLYGGTLLVNMKAGLLQTLPYQANLMVVYAGYKTPTAEVIAKVKEGFEKRMNELFAIDQSIDQLTCQAAQAIDDQDWTRLGHLMSEQQQLMNAMGLNTPEIDHIIEDFNKNNAIAGCKISGSGLGDCVIAIAHNNQLISVPLSDDTTQWLDVRLGTEGLRHEQ